MLEEFVTPVLETAYYSMKEIGQNGSSKNEMVEKLEGREQDFLQA